MTTTVPAGLSVRHRIGRWLPARLIARRLLALPFLVLIVITAAFLVFHALPGDPARTLGGPYADEATIQAIREDLGLADPLPTAYREFLSGIMRGDLGTSYFSNSPVTEELRERFPSTIQLIITSLGFAFVWGAVLGGTSAYFRGRASDRVARVVVGIQQAVPDFVVGLVLVYFLAFRFELLPQPTGQLPLTATEPPRTTGMLLVDSVLAGEWGTFGEAVRHMILPSIALGTLLSAVYARVVRSRLSAALQGPQVEYARALGLRERTILRYALTDARTALLTYTALLTGALFGSSAIVESIFNWDGVSSWGVSSISELDIPAMQGYVIVVGLATILLYLVLDVVVGALDPRLKVD